MSDNVLPSPLAGEGGRRRGEGSARPPWGEAPTPLPAASRRPSPARGEGKSAVAVVFALEREAAPFRKRCPDVNTIISGVGAKAAQHAARIAIEECPRFVIAAGFCGALSPALAVGDIVRSPRILTVDYLVAEPAEKRRLAEHHNADAVDMESAAIEHVCAEHSVPFLAVRAVSDTSDTALSPELVRLLSGGNVSVGKAMRALFWKPSLLGEFRRLARDTKLAANRLADALAEIIKGERPV